MVLGLNMENPGPRQLCFLTRLKLTGTAFLMYMFTTRIVVQHSLHSATGLFTHDRL